MMFLPVLGVQRGRKKGATCMCSTNPEFHPELNATHIPEIQNWDLKKKEEKERGFSGYTNLNNNRFLLVCSFLFILDRVCL